MTCFGEERGTVESPVFREGRKGGGVSFACLVSFLYRTLEREGRKWVCKRVEERRIYELGREKKTKRKKKLNERSV